MSQLPSKESSRAVFIGYEGPTASDHGDDPASVGRSLTDLHSLLTDPDTGVFDRRHTDILLGKDCTKARVSQALIDAAASAKDTFLVYYAGELSQRDDLYLFLADTHPDVPAATGLPISLIRQILLVCPARNKVLILDGKSSGLAVDPTRPIGHLAERSEITGAYTLVSESPREAAASSREGYTGFTGTLIELLRDGVPEGSQFLTLDVLYQGLRSRLSARGLPHPTQHGTNVGHDVALGRNPAYTPPHVNPWPIQAPPPSPPAPPSPLQPQQGQQAYGQQGYPGGGGPGYYGYGSSQPEDWPSASAPDHLKRKKKKPKRQDPYAGRLDAVSRAVRAAVRPGLLAFNPPKEMIQGRKERVEVGIARSPELREALISGLRGRGEPRFETVATAAHMCIELKGPAFEIIPFSPLEQLVAPTARWEFDVLPCRAGRQTLTLCVSLRLEPERSQGPASGQIAIPVLEREILIRVDVGYGTRRFIENNWQWLIATIVGLGGGVAAWITLVH